MARRLLAPGDEVEIVYLAARERGIVEAVEDGGRVVVVVSEEDSQLLRFRLAATAGYISVDGTCRLASSPKMRRNESSP